MPKKVDESGFEIFTGGSGRREGQKLKPYLVMQYLLKKRTKATVSRRRKSSATFKKTAELTQNVVPFIGISEKSTKPI